MATTRTVAASIGQRLLGLMEHYRGAESSLNVPVFYRLRGKLDQEALAAALNALVERHEVLRTTYEFSGRRLVQHVGEPRPVELECRTLGDDPAAREAELRERARARFDLNVSPIRATLWEVAPDEALLLLNIHHLSTDGWSGGVLSGDLGRLYRPGGPSAGLPPVTSWQYSRFCEWQQQRQADGVLAEHQRFWRERLAGTRAPSLPGEASGRVGAGQLPATETFALDASTVAGLAEFCRARRVTTYVATLAVFAAVVHAQTGDTDFGVASMFANRARPELAETVGFLANLLVLRLALPERPTFEQILEVAQDIVFDALVHQETPYHLVPQTAGERGAGLENILFQVMAGPEYQLTLEGLSVTQMQPPSGVGSRFDLEFALMPSTSAIEGIVWYDRRRFPTEWVRRLMADYAAMADAVVADPARPVGELLPR